MINLEWLRTFRTVYKTKSLSKAAEILSVSQPTVSQQLSSLETRIGQKLFDRKSKGVLETDAGRMLNTMISGSIEMLESAEHEIVKRDSKFKNIISIGISAHLYKTILCTQILELGEYVHVRFDTKQNLITAVERGELLYAIIPDEINTFDTICHPFRNQKIVLVGTPEIDFSELPNIYQNRPEEAEKWLSQFKWFAHDNNSNFIKIFWLTLFDKKRPSIVPNYIVPNEYEVLFQQSKSSGLSVAFDTTVAPFVKQGQLQMVELKEVIYRRLSLIANKKKSDSKLTAKFLEKVNRILI